MLDEGALSDLLLLLSNVQSYRYLFYTKFLDVKQITDFRSSWKILNVSPHHLPSLLGINPDIERTEELFSQLQSRNRSDLPYYSDRDVDVFFDGSPTHEEQEACTPIYYTLLKPTSTAPEVHRIQSLSLSFEGSGQFDLVAKRTMPKEYPLTNSLSTLQNLTLKGYDFSPHCGNREHYVDFPRPQRLELVNCRGLGYLFNKMLLGYKENNLKALKIHQAALRSQDPGYFGKEKLEQLLMLLNTGLEELTFANLGANRPSVLAISAQGSTLQKLVMHETQHRSSSVQKPTLSAADIRLLFKQCVRLDDLAVDLGAKQLIRLSPTADLLMQFESITHLEIALTPRDQSLIQDRTSALAIFTNVASPRLRRLDIYSAASCTESKAQPCTLKGDVQCHWCIDRVGKDVVAVDATCLVNNGRHHLTPI